jgi:dUTP pyrophosphatase
VRPSGRAGPEDSEVVVRCLLLHERARLPKRMTAGSSGFDLFASLSSPVSVPPGGRACIDTGVVMEIPPGYEGQVRPRSGLALCAGIGVLNSPGTIDADYRGEIKVIVVNLGQEVHVIRDGDRIAQLVVQRVPAACIEEVNALPGTERGEGGFGHTDNTM